MNSLALGSVTTAIKGREVLRKNGIHSVIKRYTGEKQIGCGYVLQTQADYSRCVGILSSAGIKVLDVRGK